jgi:hypothetical protein
MNRRQFLRIGAPVAAPLLLSRRSTAQTATPPAAAPAAAPDPGADGWIALFNGRNLDGWYTYLQRSGRNPANIDEYARVENGLLHILDRDVNAPRTESGFLSTLTEYENVRIRVECKWGVKRFAPRTEYKRDNGLLYHVVGPDRVFPRCIECQIQETDVGDVFFVDQTRGVQGVLPGFGGAGFIGLVNGTPNARGTVSTTRLLKDGDFENRDDWNTIEVIAQGDRATHLVNGRIVNRLMNLEQPDPDHEGQFIPLTRGRIGIEIEFAEIWYRRIDVKPLA